MRRRLTGREVLLLGLLLVLSLVGGYTAFFYMPVTGELERLKSEKALCEEQTAAAQLRLEDKRRMERELEEIFAENPDPPGLAQYDNQKPVMMELNSILKAADSYTLSFGTADSGGEDGIVRRRISLGFTSGSYGAAKEVLGRLHDSAYRCMMDDLSVSFGGGGDYGPVSVNVSLVFFEYK